MSSISRSARIEARIAPDALAIVKRAAEIEGRSVSDFVVAAAHEAACRTVRDAHVIDLTIDAQQEFAKALASPPKPTKALKRAFELRRMLIAPDR